jgi:hypothetical protein
MALTKYDRDSLQTILFNVSDCSDVHIISRDGRIVQLLNVYHSVIFKCYLYHLTTYYDTKISAFLVDTCHLGTTYVSCHDVKLRRPKNSDILIHLTTVL